MKIFVYGFVWKSTKHLQFSSKQRKILHFEHCILQVILYDLHFVGSRAWPMYDLIKTIYGIRYNDNNMKTVFDIMIITCPPGWHLPCFCCIVEQFEVTECIFSPSHFHTIFPTPQPLPPLHLFNLNKVSCEITTLLRTYFTTTIPELL